ncbi:hypothetical protein GNF78_17645 [Clostridium perfringens]
MTEPFCLTQRERQVRPTYAVDQILGQVEGQFIMGNHDDVQWLGQASNPAGHHIVDFCDFNRMIPVQD